MIGKYDSRKGFSMVELLLAMTASSIMAITIGSVLYFVWVSWRSNNESVEMQRDATMAFRAIAREVRRTPAGGITTGNSLVCVNTNGTYSFVQNGNNLNIQYGNGETFTLVRGIVTGFSTEPANNRAVVVSLELNTPSDNSSIENTIYTRN
jgi:prepilin-type N-terminal cleavage/methylation domain-containing protein